MRFFEVYAQPGGQGEWKFGSGYFLGGRLVLTAAHVVVAEGQPCAVVKVRDKNGLIEAAVSWFALDADQDSPRAADVALLEITGNWQSPPGEHRTAWGRLATRRVEQRCYAVGYPDVVATPRRRDRQQAVGVLNPESLTKSGRLALEVHNSSEQSAHGTSWSGMSGAALVSEDHELVLGVVVSVAAGFAGKRLIAMPIDVALADTEFCALVQRHVGRYPTLDSVELRGLDVPIGAANSPAGLLRAEVAETPFRDRKELEQLEDWCDAPDRLSLRLVTGVGGQGKTRLARKLVDHLKAKNWATVILQERAPDESLRVLADVALPLLVVLDYTESRIRQLDEVLELAKGAGSKVRVLLLARTAGEWRTDHRVASTNLELLEDDSSIIELSPVESTVTGRQDAWVEAARTLADGLARLDGYADRDWSEATSSLTPPPLDGDSSWTILAIQFDALVHLLRPLGVLSDSQEALDVLLAHEARYWRRVANRFGLDLDDRTLRRLVAALTLWGSQTSGDLGSILGVAVSKIHGDSSQRDQVAKWLTAVYVESNGSAGSVQPDPLADYLISKVLFDSDDSGPILGVVLRASATQLMHGIATLGRASTRFSRLDKFTELIFGLAGSNHSQVIVSAIPDWDPERYLARLLEIASSADHRTLLAIDDALPRRSMSLVGLRIAVGRRVVELDRTVLREFDESNAADERRRELLVFNLARSLHNLGARLHFASFVESRLVTREAVELFRYLVDCNHAKYATSLSSSLSNIAEDFLEAKRHDEAVQNASEALDLLRELASHGRKVRDEDLSYALNVLAESYRLADRHEEAANLAKESARIVARLAEHDKKYLPHLARSVSSLAKALGETEDRATGLREAERAVALYRDAVAIDRDANIAGLADAVYCLAIDVERAGRLEEALELGLESIELYEELSVGSRAAFDKEAAQVELNYAFDCFRADRIAEARRYVDRVYRRKLRLVESDRSAHMADLGIAARLSARIWVEVGDNLKAAEMYKQAVTCFDELSGDDDTHLKDLANCLAGRGSALAMLSKRDAAAQCYKASADVYWKLVHNSHPEFTTPLFQILAWQYRYSLRKFRIREAMNLVREIVYLRQRFNLSMTGKLR